MSGEEESSHPTDNSTRDIVMSQLDVLTKLMKESLTRLASVEDEQRESKVRRERRAASAVASEDGQQLSSGQESPSGDLALANWNMQQLAAPVNDENQDGIRAIPLWMSQGSLNRDLPKNPLKLENPNDYNIWKFSIIRLLEREGFYPFVTGAAKEPRKPSDPTSEEARLYFRWKEFNNATENVLLGSIGRSQIALMSQCKNAREMWVRLENLYLQKSDVNIAKLEDDLQNIKWRRNSSLESYIQEIDRLADLLRGCGLEITENRLRMILLRGLPDRLENVRHLLLQLGPKPYQSLCDDLRAHVGLSNMNDSKAFLGYEEGPSEIRSQEAPSYSKSNRFQKSANKSASKSSCFVATARERITTWTNVY
jgi:gag-polypeptide of LTR copia-type